MVKYESKCKECTNALEFFNDEKGILCVNCKVQGIRKARGHKSFCKDFDEHYDFTLVNMEKPFEEWQWVRKEGKSYT